MPQAPTHLIARTDPTTDAELLARASVDPVAFDELFRRHASAIFAFAAARVGPSHAEDITADTFSTAWEQRARYNPDYPSARPWLYGIAVNKLRRHRAVEQQWLTRNALGGRFGTSVDAGSYGSDAELAQAETRSDARRAAPRLAAALAALSPAERDVLLLFVFEELTHAEIALALGIRRGTAKTRLSRGRERLHRELTTDHSTDSSPETTDTPEVHHVD